MAARKIRAREIAAPCDVLIDTPWGPMRWPVEEVRVHVSDPDTIRIDGPIGSKTLPADQWVEVEPAP